MPWLMLARKRAFHVPEVAKSGRSSDNAESEHRQFDLGAPGSVIESSRDVRRRSHSPFHSIQSFLQELPDLIFSTDLLSFASTTESHKRPSRYQCRPQSCHRRTTHPTLIRTHTPFSGAKESISQSARIKRVHRRLDGVLENINLPDIACLARTHRHCPSHHDLTTLCAL